MSSTKKWSKALAAFAVAALTTMALAMPAFAANITVENPQTGATYTGYKIFDMTKSGDNYAYTLDSDSAAYTLLTSADNIYGATIAASTALDSEGKTIYNASVTNAASFAAWLKDNASSLNGGITGSTSGDKVVITTSDNGYYFVSTTSGALANLTTVDDQLTIYDKNETPEIEKTVDDSNGVEVGQAVTYTITGKIPSTVGYSSYTYKISDTMSEGLTFTGTDADFTVTIGGETVVNPTVTYSDNGFVLNIDATQYAAGASVVVTYKATVNSGAVVTLTKNSATLEYSNDPAKDTTGKTNAEEVVVWSSRIVIDKYANENENQKLSGASFVLVKKDGEAEKFYAESDGVVSWADSLSGATVRTTDNNGAATFAGLEDGTYYLRETAAPTGYNLLEADTQVVVTGAVPDGGTQKVGVSATSSIANASGSILPSTGGMGTTILYVVGGIMIVAAGLVLVVKRRLA